MNRYLLEREGDFVTSYLLGESGEAVEIRCERFSQADQPGDIYKARMMKIAWGTGGGFVRFREGVNGYIPLDTLRNAHFYHKSKTGQPCEGDELLVMVNKIPEGNKLVSMTGNISMAGSLAVVDAGNLKSGVSSKIHGKKAGVLAHLADELSDGRAGVVIRTAAADAEEKEIAGQVRTLQEKLEKILERAPSAACPSCLYRQPPAWITRILRTDPGTIDEIVSDDPDICRALQKEMPEEIREKVRLYESSRQSMNACYRLGRELSRATSRKVWLRSGAYLVIDPTEALTVIDVNSGKATIPAGGGGRSGIFLKLNMEAARECALQIRLRNLSGIIIVDFINLEREEDKTALMKYLQQLLDQDPVKCTAVDMTRLNLAEIVRQRKEPPLAAMRAYIRQEDDHVS